RIGLRMPTGQLPAAAGRDPKAPGRRGTTRPRANPSVVRGWSGADHRANRHCDFPVASTTWSTLAGADGDELAGQHAGGKAAEALRGEQRRARSRWQDGREQADE